MPAQIPTVVYLMVATDGHWAAVGATDMTADDALDCLKSMLDESPEEGRTIRRLHPTVRVPKSSPNGA